MLITTDFDNFDNNTRVVNTIINNHNEMDDLPPGSIGITNSNNENNQINDFGKQTTVKTVNISPTNNANTNIISSSNANDFFENANVSVGSNSNQATTIKKPNPLVNYGASNTNPIPAESEVKEQVKELVTNNTNRSQPPKQSLVVGNIGNRVNVSSPKTTPPLKIPEKANTSTNLTAKVEDSKQKTQNNNQSNQPIVGNSKNKVENVGVGGQNEPGYHYNCYI